MRSHRSKPYFANEIVESIISIFEQEITRVGAISVDDKFRNALREYIQSCKSSYENNILAACAEGEFLCTVLNKDEVAYKPAPPDDETVMEIIELARKIDPSKVPTKGQVEQTITMQRAQRLSHALNMATMRGRPRRLNLA